MQDIKFLHILHPNDTSYWFIKTIKKFDNAKEHRFLIAANEKTVLTKNISLFEFHEDIEFLVGGTEGKEWKRRCKNLLALLDRAKNIVWHGISFDTILFDKIISNKKIAKKSKYVIQPHELTNSNDDRDISKKDKKAKEKILTIINKFSCISYTDKALSELVEEQLGISKDRLIYTPYVMDNNFYKSTKKSISNLWQEELEYRKKQQLICEEMTQKEITENFDDAAQQAVEKNEDEKVFLMQFDFYPYTYKPFVAKMVLLKDFLMEKVKFIVPNNIWIEGFGSFVKPVSRRDIAIEKSMLKDKKSEIIFTNSSFSLENYYKYLFALDAVILLRDWYVDYTYLHACIMADMVFIISKKNKLYKFVKKSGCKVITVEEVGAVGSDDWKTMLLGDNEIRNFHIDYVKDFYDINKYVSYWKEFFKGE